MTKLHVILPVLQAFVAIGNKLSPVFWHRLCLGANCFHFFERTVRQRFMRRRFVGAFIAQRLFIAVGTANIDGYFYC